MSQTRPPVHDERYATPVEASRRGAHRARPNAASVTLPVIAGLVVVLVVVGVAWTLLSSPSTKSNGSTALGAQDSVTATVPASGGSASSPASDGTPATPSGAASTTLSSPTGSGTADKALHVRLVNTTTVKGLAARLLTTLTQDGWTDVEKGTGTGGYSVTRIYYGSSADEASAKQLAKDLGAGTLMKSATKAPTGLVVWIGKDLST